MNIRDYFFLGDIRDYLLEWTDDLCITKSKSEGVRGSNPKTGIGFLFQPLPQTVLVALVVFPFSTLSTCARIPLPGLCSKPKSAVGVAMAMRMMEVANSWAHPPEGILDRIFSHLPSYADRASCTGVCKLWRSFAREEENTAPLLLPCLLRPSTSRASCFHFFSWTITDRPTVPAARFCGSTAGGWFVVARDQWRGYALLHLHLASGTQIPLPQGLREEHGVPVIDLRVGLNPTAQTYCPVQPWRGTRTRSCPKSWRT